MQRQLSQLFLIALMGIGLSACGGKRVVWHGFCKGYLEKVVFQKVLIANAKLLPIKKANDILTYIDKVDKIQSVKLQNPEEDTYYIESQLDHLVYQLYGLTNAEVKIVDPEAKVTGADNELFKAE